jgi:Arc/MetJ-type ribon-helix-helix transcriptional regulator
MKQRYNKGWKYKNVPIPQPLFEQVEQVVKSGYYVTVTEFIKESIRLRLEEISKNLRLRVSPSPSIANGTIYPPEGFSRDLAQKNS